MCDPVEGRRISMASSPPGGRLFLVRNIKLSSLEPVIRYLN